MLLLLVVEILATVIIGQNKDMSGIRIGDISLKINLMADDTTLFLADVNSLINDNIYI